MYQSMKKTLYLFKGQKDIHLKVVGTGIFSAFTYLAWNYTRTLNGTLDCCSTWISRNKAKCQSYSRNFTNKKKSTSTERDEPAQMNPHENEYRIILLGATGSGKSSAGNFLLKKDGFKTSCYAKSETKESTLRTLTWEEHSKTYKIDIIDTPAFSDTGLSKEEIEREVKKAIALSAPGPHAFLLCIPATSYTTYYKEALQPYNHYFNNISNFTIVAVTRYDKLNNEDRETLKLEMESEHNPNNIIILGKEDKVDKTAELINKIKLRNLGYAKCK